MTDLIERVGASSRAGAGPDHPVADRDGDGPVPEASGVRWVGRAVLAGVLACSALLLFVTASEQFQGWRMGALALAVGAWAQTALAIGVLVRPSRWILRLTTDVSLAVVAGWGVVLAVHRQPSVFGAAVGAGLSVLAITAAVLLSARPGLASSWKPPTLVLASILPLSVVVLTVVALSVPATGVSKTAAGPSTTAGDPLQASVTVPGQSASRFQSIASGNDTEKSENLPYVPLDAQTQAALDGQLAQAEEAAMRFPTVASAKAAGMVLAGGMAPGVGAHYQVMDARSLAGVNADGTVNASEPASWIYASTADDAPVVGIMYESLSSQAPSGFAGPNDHWHQHSNLCITYSNGMIGVPFAPDASVTPQECADVHGHFMAKTVWMVHAWVVPGWESPQGVFSHANLHVYCPGNTDLTDAIGFCLRQQ